MQEVAPTVEEIYSSIMEMESIDSPELPGNSGVSGNDSTSLPSLGGINIDDIILLGEKVFDIIKKGAPVVDIKRDSLAVIPRGITSWEQLAGWKSPVTKVFRITMLNGFKQSMVDMRLKISAVYGGSYKNAGRYLSNVTLIPSMVKTSWGVTLDVWTESRDPVNIGSLKNPVAGLGMDVRYRAKTIFSQVDGVQDFFVDGNGNLTMEQ